MTIKSEILALKGRTGEKLHAGQVIDWARAHPNSRLHRAIEWNDAKAAADYRLWQVRQLIQVHVVDEDDAPIFVSLSVDRTAGGGYRAISDVLKSRTLSEVMFSDAAEELKRVREKYELVDGLMEVWRAVDKVNNRRARKKAAAEKGGGDAART